MPTPHQWHLIRWGPAFPWPNFNDTAVNPGHPTTRLASLALLRQLLQPCPSSGPIGLPNAPNTAVVNSREVPSSVVWKLIQEGVPDLLPWPAMESTEGTRHWLVGIYWSYKLRSMLQVKLIQVQKLPGEDELEDPVEWATFNKLRTQKLELLEKWHELLGLLDGQTLKALSLDLNILASGWKYWAEV